MFQLFKKPKVHKDPRELLFEECAKDIPEIADYSHYESVGGTLSGETKFVVTSKYQKRYLLELCPSTTNDGLVKKAHYSRLLNYKTTISVPDVTFGNCHTNGQSYLLQPWIDGTPLEVKLQKLSSHQQYQLGLDAGKMLHKIHSTVLSQDILDTASTMEHLYAKWARYWEYVSRNGESSDLLQIRTYLETHHLSDQHKRCLLHGDYHIGNIIMTPQNQLIALDWLPLLIDDPIEDFCRILISAELCSSFATGQIDGYFPEGVPNDFWSNLLIRMLSHQIGIVNWINPPHPSGQGFAEHQRAFLLEQYQGLTTLVPAFYSYTHISNGGNSL